jgi:predicted transcriptional regulator of viral defense system
MLASGPRNWYFFATFEDSVQVRPSQFLATHRVFTTEELSRALATTRERPRATLHRLLALWTAERRVEQVKRGVYVRAGERLSGADFRAIGARLTRDAALAYHTALEVHGLAQSHYQEVVVATSSKVAPVDFQGHRFRPVRPRVELIRSTTPLRWTEVVDHGGHQVRVTTRERTVVDVLDRPDLSGGFEEAWRSCSALAAFDTREAREYLALLGRAILWSKVGFFLERHRDALNTASADLDEIARHVPRQPVYLERGMPGALRQPWNLIVPERSIAEEWEGMA